MSYRNEILAGMTVAMTMIPESLSFAILAGLSPQTGLYAAFLMGLVAAVLGGRPGLVSGGAGATIVVMIALIQSHGVEYLFAAVVVAGFIQVLVGVMKWGKFVRLIPQPVMYGFLNGLAVIIFMAQVKQFQNSEGAWLSGPPAYVMLGLTALTVVLVLVIPRLTKAVPASLLAIIIAAVLVYFFGIETKQVGDIAGIQGSLPAFRIPDIAYSWESLVLVLPYSFVMASVGLVESLLTLSMVDERTQSKGDANREAMAQGAANAVNGFFGGMGGCAMVAQTLVNLDAGAKTRWAAIIGAFCILLVILVGGPLIEAIPMAALVGVMMMVAIQTFQWVTFRIIRKMPVSDILVGVVVTLITILLHNLALAVLVGVLISALVFVWDHAKQITVVKTFNEEGNTVYAVQGTLFFGSTATFLEAFELAKDTDLVMLDFRNSRVADMSGIGALQNVVEKYEKAGKKMVLLNLNAESVSKLKKADFVPRQQAALV